MNKLIVVFGLFGLTFFFGLGVTAVQLVTDSFLFPFDSGGGFDVDDLLDFNDSNNEEVMFDTEAVQESFQSEYSEMTLDSGSQVDIATTESGVSWTCGDGTIIDGAWTSGGDCDCNDCSDETVFRYSNGEFITTEYLNDGDCDCVDSCEDEG